MSSKNLLYEDSKTLTGKISKFPGQKLKDCISVTAQGEKNKTDKSQFLLPKLNFYSFTDYCQKNKNKSKVISCNKTSSLMTDHNYCIKNNVQSGVNLDGMAETLNKGSSLEMKPKKAISKKHDCNDDKSSNKADTDISDNCKTVVNNPIFDEICYEEVVEESDKTNQSITGHIAASLMDSHNSEESSSIHTLKEFNASSQNIEKNSSKFDQKSFSTDNNIVDNINYQNSINEKLSKNNQKKFVEDNRIDNLNSKDNVDKISKLDKNKCTVNDKAGNKKSQNTIKKTPSNRKRLSTKVDTPDSLAVQSNLKILPLAKKIKHLAKTVNIIDNTKNVQKLSDDSLTEKNELLTLPGSVPVLNKEITETFNCGICKQQFNNIQLLDQHVTCHMQRKYRCIECNISFINNYREIEIHFIDFHMKKIFIKSEKIKSNDFSPKPVIQRVIEHISDKDLIKVVGEPESKDESVKSEQLQSNQEISLVKNPFVKPIKKEHCNSKNKKYICRICLSQFQGKNNFIRHKRRHKELFTAYRCSSTSLTFSNSKLFTVHIQNCVMCRELLQCKLCEKICLDKLHLKRHVNSHRIENLYNCNLCCYSSISFAVLKKHLQQHEEHYSCNDCVQQFKSKKLLQIHWDDHHKSVKNLFCSSCNQDFNEMQYLIQHMKSEHKEHFMQWIADKII